MSATMTLERRRLVVTGVVQGVGFRPFVYALAIELGVAGHVGNDAAGVFVEIEGPTAALDAFAQRLVAEQPPLAHVDAVAVTGIAPTGEAGFTIVQSTHADGPRTIVPPDVATCPDCLAELSDPTDRRHRYPFVNCTNCGPRFTIIRDLPYDRPNTTMAGFTLCDACDAEYRDPTDRRYHAQPVACPDCGPQLALDHHDGRHPDTVGDHHHRDGDDRHGDTVSGTVTGGDHVTGTDAVLARVHTILAAGGVVAIKGLGGYHLAVDATNDDAVERLRARKGRSDKPFAVMAPDLATVREIASVGADEETALTDPARPIVLLRRAGDGTLAPSVAPGNPLVGVMLPYTPLHHLLFAPVPGTDPRNGAPPPRVLVMTSGNRSNEPICFDDADARERLADLADAFCTHDRPIEVPCDDSVVRVIDGDVQPIRRARGYAPVPVRLPFDVPPVLGVGGELKNTCCVAAGRHAWVGQHVGDMENLATLQAFDASVTAFSTMYRVDPAILGVDRHPGYLTRRWALDRSARRDLGDAPRRVVDVQHHHAHVASVMAEHGLPLDAEVLGVAFDGTGYGDAADGSPQIWGGEVLLAGYRGFERVAHLAPLPLPGGDEAVRNPCRIAIAYLTAVGLDLDDHLPAVQACDEVERSVVPQQVRRHVGCTPTTSMGRLFDAVSSLLGVRHRATYEAQAAIELEHLAERGDASRTPLHFDMTAPGGVPTLIDPWPVLAGIVDHLRSGADPADLAAAFHAAVADAIGMVAHRHAGGRPVALTGGTFQNALLTRLARERLADHEVLTHRLVPPNDGGLSLGQAVVAAVAARDDDPVRPAITATDHPNAAPAAVERSS